MVKKLKVISQYKNTATGELYPEGSTIEVDPLHAEFLKRDAPGCFEDWIEPKAKPKRKAPSKPRANKQVKRPAVKK